MGNAAFILFIICLLNMSDTNESSSGRRPNQSSRGQNATQSQRRRGSQTSAFSLNFAANQTIFGRSRRGQNPSTSQTPQQITSTSSVSAAASIVVTCLINFIEAKRRRVLKY